MNKSILSLVVVTLLFAVSANASMVVQAKAYAVTNGAQYGSALDKQIDVLDDRINPIHISRWDVPGIAQPSTAQLPTVAVAEVILFNARQDNKSDLHKLADVALINVLIRGSLVSSNTVALAEGNTTQIKMTLLHMEIESPDNEDLQKLSTKLDRLISIIESEGGDPDDAIVHPEI